MGNLVRRAAVLCALTLVACSGTDDASVPEQARNGELPVATAERGANARAASSAAPKVATLAGRSVELAAPSAEQMVILLHQLAGLPIPIDSWVESDQRVQGARGGERAERRALVRAEFEATVAAMQSVGIVRVALGQARLSEYDAGYGEFTIGALAPSSTIPYRALGRQVAITFVNAATVQTLSMPADSARMLLDAIGSYYDPSIDLVLAIEGAIPDREGGTIRARVVQYELRSTYGGGLLLRRRF